MKNVILWSVALILCAAWMGPCEEGRASDETVPIMISPSVVNLESQGVWVTVHAEIPYADVDGCTVTLDGIPVDVTKADARGELVAKFAVDDVKSALEPGFVELTLSGTTYDGDTFRGADEIQVICVKGRR